MPDGAPGTAVCKQERKTNDTGSTSLRNHESPSHDARFAPKKNGRFTKNGRHEIQRAEKARYQSKSMHTKRDLDSSLS